MEKEIRGVFKLKINGSCYLYRSDTSYTVLNLVNYLGFNKNVVVIDYNGFVLEKPLWSKTFFSNRDSIEILSIAGGG